MPRRFLQARGLLEGNLYEIADRLFVLQNTIKSHPASIYREFGVTSRCDAANRAGQAGRIVSELPIKGKVP